MDHIISLFIHFLKSIGMRAWGRKHRDRSVGSGAWEHEDGDGSEYLIHTSMGSGESSYSKGETGV